MVFSLPEVGNSPVKVKCPYKWHTLSRNELDLM